ncbi:hypothetical protein BJF85_00220 [Saccharomonospora sp. CUA-673]|nr:hypothetical protein BJF85_00220 [Saccharomonospora sp. CUA-673]
MRDDDPEQWQAILTSDVDGHGRPSAYATLCAMTALAYAATTSVADLLDLEHEEVVRRHANHLARAAMDDNETGGDGS